MAQQLMPTHLLAPCFDALQYTGEVKDVPDLKGDAGRQWSISHSNSTYPVKLPGA